MKKLLFIIFLFSLPLTVFCEWNQIPILEGYFEAFDVYHDVWINDNEKIIVFEDHDSTNEDELLYNINYTLTVYSFFLEDNDTYDQLVKYNIAYLYYIKYKGKEYRLDVEFPSDSISVLFKESKKQINKIVNFYLTAKVNFNNKYPCDIDKLWVLKNTDTRLDLQTQLDKSINNQSLETFKK